MRHAWGLVDGPCKEFLALVGGRAVPSPDHVLARFVREADVAFERQRESLCSLVRDELGLLSRIGAPEGSAASRWIVAPRRLGHEIRHLDDARRRRIATGQIHMTANRLGLLNAEEVYAARMLWRATRELAVAEAPTWREAWTVRQAETASPGRPLHEQVRSALHALATDTGVVTGGEPLAG